MSTSPASTTVSSHDRDSIMQLANENPLRITIKEITKPEEIRITDDKPKPFNPFKSTTTTSTTAATTTATATANIASTTAVSLDVTTETDVKPSTETSTITITTETLKESKELSTEDPNPLNRGENDYVDNGVSIDNNSSDAPPTVKAAVEPEVLSNSGTDSNSIADDASNKNVRQTVEHSTSSDIDPFSDVNYISSTTEMATEASSTPSDASTTENGEEFDLVASSTPRNVVVVRHGGKTESFHVTGTDGLERVEEEVEMEASSTTENNSQEISTSTNGNGRSGEMTSAEVSTIGEPEPFDDTTGSVVLAIEKKFDKTLNANDLSNNSIEVSTLDDGTLDSASEFAPSEKIYETVYYESEEISSTASPSDDGPSEAINFSSTEDTSDSSSTTEQSADILSSTTTANDAFSTTDQSTASAVTTEAPSSTKGTVTYEDDQEVTLGENPSYPYIPDDVSIHHKEVTEPKYELPPPKVSDETFVSSTAGPACAECGIKIVEVSSTQAPPEEEQRSEIVVQPRVSEANLIISEDERSTTEKATIIEPSTTLGPNDANSGENKTATVPNESSVAKAAQNAALMLETTVASIDSDEKYGRKEPTTERSTTKGYAKDFNDDDSSDNLSSSALDSSSSSDNSTEWKDKASPKDDAVPIKIDSSANVDDDDDTNKSLEFKPQTNSLLNHFRNLNQVNNWGFVF